MHPAPLRNSPLPPTPRHRSATESLAGMHAVVLFSALIAGLYFGREFLIPLALAALITFLLSPFVGRLERFLGKIGAVIAIMLLIVGGTVGLGWTLGNQAVDLANQLPAYKENIRSKLKDVQMPRGGTLDKVAETVEDLKKDLPGAAEKAGGKNPAAPIPVEVVANPESNQPFSTVGTMVAPILGPLGTAGLVLLVATFMLLKRDDLQGRLIRLIGQGRISATTRAMDDAASRVRRYLLMQLVVNVTYGIPLAIGLYFIGVPNALLWGVLAAVLRFIPYIGPWIAAAFPVVLSLAVSPSWMPPLMTIGLFVVLELLSNNVMEPWLYGSSTGVSSIALIIAAIFWTWLWGTPGLVLATPITVCMVVMGRHIPHLSFLSVVLGEEEALTPAEDCYRRMLRHGEHDETELVDSFLKSKPLEELYDQMLIPVIATAEEDHRQGLIDDEQRDRISAAVRELRDELEERFTQSEEGEEDADAPAPLLNVRCLPARAERDELAGAMIAHVLSQKGFEAHNTPGRRSAAEIARELTQNPAEIACITVIAPSKAIHARNLCRRIRAVLPEQRILVCLWGGNGEAEEEIKMLREAGAEEVCHSVAETCAWCERLAMRESEGVSEAPVPENEEERLLTLENLGLVNPEREPVLDHVTAKMARVFEAPIAAITLVDRDRQYFKAYSGLPEELAEARESPRELSVCTHVVAANQTVVVEDLKRDRRFAGNPLFLKHELRFYAGAPIRGAGGQVLGALCVMDTEPRRFSRREKRLLEENAAEVASEIERLAGIGA